MDELKQQVKELTPSQWSEFMTWIMIDERKRREAAPEVDAAKVEMIQDLKEKGEIQGAKAVNRQVALDDPSKVPTWEDPKDQAFKMYLPGDVVSYGKKIVESTYGGLNSYKPTKGNVDGEVWSYIEEEEEIDSSGN